MSWYTDDHETGCFPQTPVGTPHQQFIKTEPTPLQPTNRFSENYDESMEETIKPSRANKNSNRNSGVFQDLRQQAEGMVQTPPRAGTIPMPLMDQNHRSPEFMNMRNVSDEFVKIERAFNGACQAPIPQTFAQQRDPFSNKPDFHAPIDPESQHTLIHHGLPSPGSKTPSRRSSPHRRAESIASITSAASIADINIEETKTETGVTLDDIAAFIRGPDPSDGKWECLYENCHKRFGRKENIKSHVQTHLNDRQYQCPTCKKCFVRQHDLKRHAKIHTGIKPYPCDCGNRFARHDALTRHRQRGMCIGAFDGIVRKVVKRGRPRKVRPDMEGRLEKSERTRRKNRLDSVSSVSSQSGCSDSSAANSPGNEFDGLIDEDQFADMDIMDVAMSSIPTSSAAATMNPSALVGVSSAPMPTISESMADVFGTALSRGANHVASPSAMSNYSHASHATTHLSSASRPATASDRTTQPLHGGGGGGGGDYRDGTADQPLRRADSPARSVASHYTHLPGTPPELSTSSSPPPTRGSGSGSAQFFDVDPNSSGISDASIGLGTTVAAHAAAAAAAAASSVAMGCGSSAMPAGGVGGLENDMLLQYADHDGLVQLDQSMLLGKFDEDFDGVSMFANEEDVFFGTT
jgi:regulatory protein SWI5